MYGKTGVVGAGVVGASSLAVTGMDVVWLVLASFALLSAGVALLRIIPRREG